MKIANFDPVVVTNTKSVILSHSQTNPALKLGLKYVAINPSVSIVLVDPYDGNYWSDIPGVKAGTVANSPFVCPANTVTMVAHGGGGMTGISTGADATVKFALAMDQ